MSEQINPAGALGFVLSVLSLSVGRVRMGALWIHREKGPGHFPIPTYAPQTKAVVHREPRGGEGMSE